MKVFTVSELTFAIKALLEPNFRQISVKGEISNCKLQSSGHLYFTLKDPSAQLSAVLFRGNATSLPRIPKEGDQVIALGEMSLYPPRGQYQMIVRELQFAGVGELLLKLEQLKKVLLERGWFDPKHKKPLPKLPKTIGVVTSPTGAVIQDIIQVLKRRFSGFHLILKPVKVQGEGAAEEIAQAIQEFNELRCADLLIVGRGGGSIEDLWAFNEEKVAEAIFHSQIPIISAVGHETDFTIADWVADLRAPTPSAAAEMAISEKSHLIKLLDHFSSQIKTRLQSQLRSEKSKVAAIQRHPLFSSPYTLLSERIQKLDHARNFLEKLNPSQQLIQFRKRLTPFAPNFLLAMQNFIAQRKERLQKLKEHLEAIHPQHLLKKGYSILFFEKSSSIILSSKELKQNQKFTALLHDGKIEAKVIETNE